MYLKPSTLYLDVLEAKYTVLGCTWMYLKPSTLYLDVLEAKYTVLDVLECT